MPAILGFLMMQQHRTIPSVPILLKLKEQVLGKISTQWNQHLSSLLYCPNTQNQGSSFEYVMLESLFDSYVNADLIKLVISKRDSLCGENDVRKRFLRNILVRREEDARGKSWSSSFFLLSRSRIGLRL